MGSQQKLDTENVLVSSYGTIYGLKIGIDEVTRVGSSVGSSEGSEDENICGLFHGISLGQEDINSMVSSYGSVDGLKLILDEGTEICYLVGSYEVSKY